MPSKQQLITWKVMTYFIDIYVSPTFVVKHSFHFSYDCKGRSLNIVLSDQVEVPHICEDLSAIIRWLCDLFDIKRTYIGIMMTKLGCSFYTEEAQGVSNYDEDRVQKRIDKFNGLVQERRNFSA